MTLNQRYLPRLYLAAWVIVIASLITMFWVQFSAVRAPDAKTGQVVGYFAKGHLVGYVTAAEDRIDLWARVVFILSLVVCWLGPVVAERAAWLAPKADKPSRLWD